MIRTDGLTSQEYRAKYKDVFVKIRDGVWGGFRRGVRNGPNPTNPKRRNRK